MGTLGLDSDIYPTSPSPVPYIPPTPQPTQQREHLAYTTVFCINDISNSLNDGSGIPSDDIQIEDDVWKIILYTKERFDDKFYASIFLDLSASKHDGFVFCNFKIKSKIESQGDFEKERRFKIENRRRIGIVDFIALEHLLNEERGLCINKALTIEVVIKYEDVEEGPVFSPIRYDSFEATGLVGFLNQGATCYMNSLLQTYYFITKLRKAVYSIQTDEDDVEKNFLLSVQRVFYHLQTNREAVSTKKLTESFGWNSADAFMQHDVQEFSRFFCDRLESKMKDGINDGVMKSLFEGEMKSYVKCINVDFESARIESFCDIQLNVKGMVDLDAAFKNYVQEETLDGENKYQAENHGLQDARRGIVFKSFPPVLQLQLKRFEYDNTGTAVKLHDYFQFPNKLDLSNYLEDKDQGPANYSLFAVLVHIGDIYGGHYNVYIRPGLDQKWFKFDDSIVTEVSEKEAIHDNYGDATQTDSLELNEFSNMASAYMLVYINDSKISDVFCDVREDEIARLEKKFERESTIQCYFLTETNVMNHEAADLYDLRNEFALSKIRNFPVLKTESLSLVVQYLEEKSEVPAGKIKLWKLEERETKAFRPILLDDVEKTVQEILEPPEKYLQFYMQIEDSPLTKEDLMIFLKYFDPNNKKRPLQSIGDVVVNQHCIIDDFLKDWKLQYLEEDCQLKVYEELCDNMIADVETKRSFGDNNLVNGDIYIIQKKEEDESNNDVIRDYFKALQDMLSITFCPYVEDKFSEPVHKMQIPKSRTGKELAKMLGKELPWDPDNLLLCVKKKSRNSSTIEFIKESDTLKDFSYLCNDNSPKIYFTGLYDKASHIYENILILDYIWKFRNGKIENDSVIVEKSITCKSFLSKVVQERNDLRTEEAPFDVTFFRVVCVSQNNVYYIIPPLQEQLPLPLEDAKIVVELIPEDQRHSTMVNELIYKNRKGIYRLIGLVDYLPSDNTESKAKVENHELINSPNAKLEKNTDTEPGKHSTVGKNKSNLQIETNSIAEIENSDGEINTSAAGIQNGLFGIPDGFPVYNFETIEDIKNRIINDHLRVNLSSSEFVLLNQARTVKTLLTDNDLILFDYLETGDFLAVKQKHSPVEPPSTKSEPNQFSLKLT